MSSKVNQWTLLIGTLPVAFALSGGSLDPLPTDTRQSEEVFLTAAQSLLAVVLLINLRMSVWEGATLLILFLAQFFTPHDIISRNVFAYSYLVLGMLFLVRQVIEMRRFTGGPPGGLRAGDEAGATPRTAPAPSPGAS